jgi:hypothetical protein
MRVLYGSLSSHFDFAVLYMPCFIARPVAGGANPLRTVILTVQLSSCPVFTSDFEAVGIDPADHH